MKQKNSILLERKIKGVCVYLNLELMLQEKQAEGEKPGRDLGATLGPGCL